LATDVLGEVVARAADASLPNVIQQLVTGPLAMKDTTFTILDASRLATAYADADPMPIRMNDSQVVRNEEELITFSPSRVFDQNSYPSGGAGMIGTAWDYLRFLESLRMRDNAILKPVSIAAMTTKAIPNVSAEELDPGWTFGLGFAVLEDPALDPTPRNLGSWRWGGRVRKQLLG
jgi:CubicO group peptidase (beta-lactamase class C family)